MYDTIFSAKNRSVDSSVPVDEDRNIYLMLSTIHNPDRKTIRIWATRAEITDRIVTYKLRADVKVIAEIQIPRYSQKTLKAEHEKLLSILTDPGYIAWAKEYKTL